MREVSRDERCMTAGDLARIAAGVTVFAIAIGTHATYQKLKHRWYHLRKINHKREEHDIFSFLHPSYYRLE